MALRANCRIRFCSQKATHNVSKEKDKFIVTELDRPTICLDHAKKQAALRNLPSDSPAAISLQKELFQYDHEEHYGKVVNNDSIKRSSKNC